MPVSIGLIDMTLSFEGGSCQMRDRNTQKILSRLRSFDRLIVLSWMIAALELSFLLLELSDLRKGFGQGHK